MSIGGKVLISDHNDLRLDKNIVRDRKGVQFMKAKYIRTLLIFSPFLVGIVSIASAALREDPLFDGVGVQPPESDPV